MPHHLCQYQRDLMLKLLRGQSLAYIAEKTESSPEHILAITRQIFQNLLLARPNEGMPNMAWSIPTRRERDALRAIRCRERGQGDVPDTADADACCQHGWAVPAPGGQQYRLTEAGREILAEPTKRRASKTT